MAAGVTAQCFMVEKTYDAFLPGGALRVGAMWWRHHGRLERDHQPRPMPHLNVMTPAGIACLDCPASKPPYGYWSRSGEPPIVTVTPSLDIKGSSPWHGNLTAGVLSP